MNARLAGITPDTLDEEQAELYQAIAGGPLAAHDAVGRTVGLTEAELTALREGRDPGLSDPAERTALRTVAALIQAGRLTDPDYDEAVAALGERGLFKLTTLVGYYATLALQLRVFAGEGGQ